MSFNDGVNFTKNKQSPLKIFSSEQVERVEILKANFPSAGWTVTTDPDTGRETLATEHVATYCGY